MRVSFASFVNSLCKVPIVCFQCFSSSKRPLILIPLQNCKCIDIIIFFTNHIQMAPTWGELDFFIFLRLGLHFYTGIDKIWYDLRKCFYNFDILQCSQAIGEKFVGCPKTRNRKTSATKRPSISTCHKRELGRNQRWAKNGPILTDLWP